MAIRVVARIRPQRQEELAKDIIVSTASAINESAVVRIPNPKNESELFTFQFSSVYDALATQQQIFDNEGKRRRVLSPDIIRCIYAKQYHLRSSISSTDLMLQSLRMTRSLRSKLEISLIQNTLDTVAQGLERLIQ